MRATPMLGMPGAAPERPLADGDVKFVGGAIGAPPTVANAVNDALAQVGAAAFAHPLSPPRLRAALDAVGA